MSTTPPEIVNFKLDGKDVTATKGQNLIEAAKACGTDIPHYCYHKDLSIAGNCRMCQVSVKGQPKLTIACNTTVTEGMEVSTHESSKEVADAQAATLEFILINHPLDCTVCDQAGHCKLQDYHFEYNARSSRFIEEKEHKVKALPLGPHVMLDGERCIMCSRCVRFCDEITKTSELGLLNRGDKTVIAVHEGKELNNPLSGTVVDLCPVGALTHRDWRFNTRVWFTDSSESICPGCSTGCNVKVHSRDGQVVQVKARYNEDVNKEWLCDEGRYGFNSFLPKARITKNYIKGKEASVSEVTKNLSGFFNEKSVIFLAPQLLTEELFLVKKIIEKSKVPPLVIFNYESRALTDVEKILVSPDRSPNFMASVVLGLETEVSVVSSYENGISKVSSDAITQAIFIGDGSFRGNDYSIFTKKAFIGTNAAIVDEMSFDVVVAGRSILEKSGIYINRNKRVQYLNASIESPKGTEPEWRILLGILAELGDKTMRPVNDRDMSLEFLKGFKPEFTLPQIKKRGLAIVAE